MKHVHRDLQAGKMCRIQIRAVSKVGPGKPRTVVVRTKRGGVLSLPGNG